MKNGIFKRSNTLGYARAPVLMSTHSATDFEWSVKFINGPYFDIGIASKLKTSSVIYSYDREAIVLDAYNSYTNIKRGTTKIHSGLKKLQTGDVIYFKFQPRTKTFVIEWVSKLQYYINSA